MLNFGSLYTLKTITLYQNNYNPIPEQLRLLRNNPQTYVVSVLLVYGDSYLGIQETNLKFNISTFQHYDNHYEKCQNDNVHAN